MCCDFPPHLSAALPHLPLRTNVALKMWPSHEIHHMNHRNKHELRIPGVGGTTHILGTGNIFWVWTGPNVDFGLPNPVGIERCR